MLEKKVDGKEITPCLNRLLKEKSTLYAPNVLTQVKGGRSIDAQLMICSGLLPLMSGTYSSLYYDNTFYTLQKAMRGLKHSRSYLLTIDKVSTWNQGAVARSFGTDTIISYHDFKMTEAFGTHKRIGDASFSSNAGRRLSAARCGSRASRSICSLSHTPAMRRSSCPTICAPSRFQRLSLRRPPTI